MSDDFLIWVKLSQIWHQEKKWKLKIVFFSINQIILCMHMKFAESFLPLIFIIELHSFENLFFRIFLFRF